MLPFHGREARALLEGCRRTVVVENNFTGQFARHLRAETGFTVDHVLTRYDGEPFEPAWIARRVQAFRQGHPVDLKVAEHEAREMAYHYVRIHLQDRARPGSLHSLEAAEYGEPVWDVELVDRDGGRPEGRLVIGADTGAIHAYHSLAGSQAPAR
jgi:hypothetical protein